MEQNREIAVKFMEYLGNYDEKIADLLDDRFEWIVPGGKPGLCPLLGSKDKTASVKSLAGFRAIMPQGIRFNIRSVTAEENRVAVEAESEALLLNGNKYSDKYQNSYLMLFEIKNGKIILLREYCDSYYATLLFT